MPPLKICRPGPGLGPRGPVRKYGPAHNRQTSMTPVGFESTISEGERPKTHALDRAATGTEKDGRSSRVKIQLIR